MLSAANAGTAQARHRSPAVHATSYGDHLLSPPPAPGGARDSDEEDELGDLTPLRAPSKFEPTQMHERILRHSK